MMEGMDRASALREMARIGGWWKGYHINEYLDFESVDEDGVVYCTSRGYELMTYVYENDDLEGMLREDNFEFYVTYEEGLKNFLEEVERLRRHERAGLVEMGYAVRDTYITGACEECGDYLAPTVWAARAEVKGDHYAVEIRDRKEHEYEVVNST